MTGFSHIINFDDPGQKRRLLAHVGIRKGWCKVVIEPKRPTRSLKANGFYWAAVVAPFAEFLSENDTRRWTPEACHEVIKCAVLGEEPIADPKTGEVIGHRLPDTHSMDVEAFCDFVDRAIGYLSETYGIIVAEPQPWAQGAAR